MIGIVASVHFMQMAKKRNLPLVYYFKINSKRVNIILQVGVIASLVGMLNSYMR